MQTKNLGGHSGCKILLCGNDKDTSYVRKISADNSYNSRLEEQCEKQMHYKSEKIFVPKIFQKGYTQDGLFYFDMEYIRGITLAQYIKTVCVSDIRSIVDDIINETICKNTYVEKNTNDIFLNKIRDVQKKTYNIYSSTITQECFNVLNNHDWNNIPKSKCHGDLTLENIIVSGDRLYYIDFLDSFYDSWVLDFAKLLQDTQAMWSYRYEEHIDTNTAIRLHIFRDILIEKTSQISADMVLEINYALLLHLARIYPYVKDDNTIQFLDKKVETTIRTIKTIQHS